jgi:hypothetical protein
MSAMETRQTVLMTAVFIVVVTVLLSIPMIAPGQTPEARTPGAALPDLACRLETVCTNRGACTPADDRFVLRGRQGGYAVATAGGDRVLRALGAADAPMRSFLFTGREGLTILMSLYRDGALTVTTHDTVGGRFAQTSFGRCGGGA